MDFRSSCIYRWDTGWYRPCMFQVSRIRCKLDDRYVQRRVAVREIFYCFIMRHKLERFMMGKLTVQFWQHGPVAQIASCLSLQVIGSQHGSFLGQSSIVPQSHSSPSSTIKFPHDRRVVSFFFSFERKRNRLRLMNVDRANKNICQGWLRNYFLQWIST